MSYEIIDLNVTQTISATPNNLQQRGAVLSFGSLMQTAGTPYLLLDRGEINERIRNPIADYSGVSTPPTEEEGGGGSGGGSASQGVEPATATSKSKRQLAAEARAQPQPLADGYTTYTLTVGDGRTFNQSLTTEIEITISGCVPDSYNGTFTATVQADNQLTWQIQNVEDDGSPTTLGYFTIQGANRIAAGLNTFFAQGEAVGVYLLDLGQANTTSAQISAFSDYLADPEKAMYAYLVPQQWDGNDAFLQLARNYTANTAKVYFFIVTQSPSDSQYTSPYKGIKSVVALVDTTYPDTNAAAMFMYLVLSADPSPVNKVAPFAFRYAQGLTAVDYRDSLTKALTEQYVNYIQTGAEGGISNNILALGVTSDGRDFAYWYSVDWIQINVRLALANAVINGSNNPINPLYYDQDGIDRLQQTAQQTFNTGTSVGLVSGAATVNAIGFRSYVRQFPSDYAAGKYGGLSCEYTPQRGFLKIVFNINVNLNPQVSDAA